MAAFLLQDVAFAKGEASPAWTAVAAARRGTDQQKTAASIPANFGLVQKSAVREGEEIIVNIQDAHKKIGAQESIAKLLEALVRDYELRMVGVEGASGRIDASVVNSFPVESVRRQVGSYLVREGSISGSELYAIASENPVPLYGVEDKDLYQENVDVFGKVINAKLEARRSLKALFEALKVLEASAYPPELRAILEKRMTKRGGDLRFEAYWEAYGGAAREKGIGLARYPNVEKLSLTVELEKKIDFRRAGAERDALIDELSKKLSKEDLRTLIMESLRFKKNEITPGAFHLELCRIALKNGLSSTRYSNLIVYSEYTVRFESIDLTALFEEITLFENEVKEALFENDDQRALDRLSRRASVLAGILETTLTSSEYAFYLANRGECSPEEVENGLEKLSARLGTAARVDFSSIRAALPSAERFYTIAEKRNETLLKNTIDRMRREKVRVAALVTGGFHSEGIAKLLESEKLSYLVVMPKFDPASGDRPYVAVLTRRPKEIEKQFAEADFYLAPPSRYDLSAELTREDQMRDVALMFASLNVQQAVGAVPAEWQDKEKAWQRYVDTYTSRYAALESGERAKRLSPADVDALRRAARVRRQGQETFEIAFASEGVAFRVARTADGKDLTGDVVRVITESGVEAATPAGLGTGTPSLEPAAFDALLDQVSSSARDFFAGRNTAADAVLARMTGHAERRARASQAVLTGDQTTAIGLAAARVASELALPSVLAPAAVEPILRIAAARSPLRAAGARMSRRFGERLEDRTLTAADMFLLNFGDTSVGFGYEDLNLPPAMVSGLVAGAPPSGPPQRPNDTYLIPVEPGRPATSPFSRGSSLDGKGIFIDDFAIPLDVPSVPLDSRRDADPVVDQPLLEALYGDVDADPLGGQFWEDYNAGSSRYLVSDEVVEQLALSMLSEPLAAEPAAQEAFGPVSLAQAAGETIIITDVMITEASEAFLADEDFRRLFSVAPGETQADTDLRIFVRNQAVGALSDRTLYERGLNPTQVAQFYLDNIYRPQLRVVEEAGPALEQIHRLDALIGQLPEEIRERAQNEGVLRAVYDYRISALPAGQLTAVDFAQRRVIEASQSYAIPGYRETFTRVNLDTGSAVVSTIDPTYNQVRFVVDDLNLQAGILNDPRFGNVLELYGIDPAERSQVAQLLGDLASQIRTPYRQTGLRFVGTPESGQQEPFQLTFTSPEDVVTLAVRQLEFVRNGEAFDFLREVYGLRSGRNELAAFRNTDPSDVIGAQVSPFLRQLVAENIDNAELLIAAKHFRDAYGALASVERAKVDEVLRILGIDPQRGLADAENIRLLANKGVLFGTTLDGRMVERDHAFTLKAFQAVIDLRDKMLALNATDPELARGIDECFMELFGFKILDGIQEAEIARIIGALVKPDRTLRDPQELIDLCEMIHKQKQLGGIVFGLSQIGGGIGFGSGGGGGGGGFGGRGNFGGSGGPGELRPLPEVPFTPPRDIIDYEWMPPDMPDLIEQARRMLLEQYEAERLLQEADIEVRAQMIVDLVYTAGDWLQRGVDFLNSLLPGAAPEAPEAPAPPLPPAPPADGQTAAQTAINGESRQETLLRAALIGLAALSILLAARRGLQARRARRELDEREAELLRRIEEILAARKPIPRDPEPLAATETPVAQVSQQSAEVVAPAAFVPVEEGRDEDFENVRFRADALRQGLAGTTGRVSSPLLRSAVETAAGAAEQAADRRADAAEALAPLVAEAQALDERLAVSAEPEGADAEALVSLREALALAELGIAGAAVSDQEADMFRTQADELRRQIGEIEARAGAVRDEVVVQVANALAEPDAEARLEALGATPREIDMARRVNLEDLMQRTREEMYAAELELYEALSRLRAARAEIYANSAREYEASAPALNELIATIERALPAAQRAAMASARALDVLRAIPDDAARVLSPANASKSLSADVVSLTGEAIGHALHTRDPEGGAEAREALTRDGGAIARVDALGTALAETEPGLSQALGDLAQDLRGATGTQAEPRWAERAVEAAVADPEIASERAEEVSRLKTELDALRVNARRSMWSALRFAVLAPLLLTAALFSGYLLDLFRGTPASDRGRTDTAADIRPDAAGAAPARAKAKAKAKAAAPTRDPYTKAYHVHRLQLQMPTAYELKVEAQVAVAQKEARALDVLEAEIRELDARLEKASSGPERTALADRLEAKRREYFARLGDPFAVEVTNVDLKSPVDVFQRKARLLRGMLDELRKAPKGREDEIIELAAKVRVAENLVKTLETKADQVRKLRQNADALREETMAAVMTSWNAMGGVRPKGEWDRELTHTLTIGGRTITVREPLGRSRWPNPSGVSEFAYCTEIKLGIHPTTGEVMWYPVRQHSPSGTPSAYVQKFRDPTSPFYFRDPATGNFVVRHAPIVIYNSAKGRIDGTLDASTYPIPPGYERNTDPGARPTTSYYSWVLPVNASVLQLTREQYEARSRLPRRVTDAITFFEENGAYYELNFGVDVTELQAGEQCLLVQDGGPIEISYERQGRFVKGRFSLRKDLKLVTGTRKTFPNPYLGFGTHLVAEDRENYMLTGGAIVNVRGLRGTGLYAGAPSYLPTRAAYDRALQIIEERKKVVLERIERTGGTPELRNQLDLLGKLVVLYQEGRTIVNVVARPSPVWAQSQVVSAYREYLQRVGEAIDRLNEELNRAPEREEEAPVLPPADAPDAPVPAAAAPEAPAAAQLLPFLTLVVAQVDPPAGKDTERRVSPVEGVPVAPPKNAGISPDSVAEPMMKADETGKHREPLGQGWLRTPLKDVNLGGQFARIVVLDASGRPAFYLTGDVRVNGKTIADIDFAKTPLTAKDKISAQYVTVIRRDARTGHPTGSMTSRLKAGSSFALPEFNPNVEKLFPVDVDVRQTINRGKSADGAFDVFEVRTYLLDAAGRLRVEDGRAKYVPHVEYRSPATPNQLFAAIYPFDGDPNVRLDIRGGKIAGVLKADSGEATRGEIEVPTSRTGRASIYNFNTGKTPAMEAQPVARLVRVGQSLHEGATYPVFERRDAKTGDVIEAFATSDAVGMKLVFTTDATGTREALEPATGNIFSMKSGYRVGDRIATTGFAATVTVDGKTYDRYERKDARTRALQRTFAVDERGKEALRYESISPTVWEVEVVATGAIHTVNPADFSLGAKTARIESTGRTVTIGGKTFTVKQRVAEAGGKVERVLGFDAQGRIGVRFFAGADGRIIEAEEVATGDIYPVTDPATFAVGPNPVARTRRAGDVTAGGQTYALRIRQSPDGTIERAFAIDAFGREGVRYYLDPATRVPTVAEVTATGALYAAAPDWTIGAQLGTTERRPRHLDFGGRSYDLLIQRNLDGTTRRIFGVDATGREVAAFYNRPERVNGVAVAGTFSVQEGLRVTDLPAGAAARRGYAGDETIQTLYYASADYRLLPALGRVGYAVNTKKVVRHEGNEWPVTEELTATGKFNAGRAVDRSRGAEKAIVTLLPEGTYQVELIERRLEEIPAGARKQRIRVGHLAAVVDGSYVAERQIVQTSYVSMYDVNLGPGMPGTEEVLNNFRDIPEANRAMALERFRVGLDKIARNLNLQGNVQLILTEVRMTNGSTNYFLRVKDDPFGRIVIFQGGMGSFFGGSVGTANVVINTDFSGSSSREGYEFGPLGQVYLQEAGLPDMTSEKLLGKYGLQGQRDEIARSGVTFPTESFSEVTRSLIDARGKKIPMDVRYLLPDDPHARDFVRFSSGAVRFIKWSTDPRIPHNVPAGEVAFVANRGLLLRETEFVAHDTQSKEYVYRVLDEFREGQQMRPYVLLGANYETGAVWEWYVNEERKLYTRDGFPLFEHRVERAQNPTGNFTTRSYVSALNGETYGMSGTETRYGTFTSRAWTHPDTGDIYVLVSQNLETSTPVDQKRFFVMKNGNLEAVIVGEGIDRLIYFDPYGMTLGSRVQNSPFVRPIRWGAQRAGVMEGLEVIVGRIQDEGTDINLRIPQSDLREQQPVYFSATVYAQNHWYLFLLGGLGALVAIPSVMGVWQRLRRGKRALTSGDIAALNAPPAGVDAAPSSDAPPTTASGARLSLGDRYAEFHAFGGQLTIPPTVGNGVRKDPVRREEARRAYAVNYYTANGFSAVEASRLYEQFKDRYDEALHDPSDRRDPPAKLTVASAWTDLQSAGTYTEAVAVRNIVESGLLGDAAQSREAFERAVARHASGGTVHGRRKAMLWIAVKEELAGRSQSAALAAIANGDFSVVEHLPSTPLARVLRRFLASVAGEGTRRVSPETIQEAAKRAPNFNAFVTGLLRDYVMRPLFDDTLARTWGDNVPQGAAARIEEAVFSDVYSAIQHDPSLLDQYVATGDIKFNPDPLIRTNEPLTARESVVSNVLLLPLSQTGKHSLGMFGAQWPLNLYVTREVLQGVADGKTPAQILARVDLLFNLFTPVLLRELKKHKLITDPPDGTPRSDKTLSDVYVDTDMYDHLEMAFRDPTMTIERALDLTTAELEQKAALAASGNEAVLDELAKLYKDKKRLLLKANYPRASAASEKKRGVINFYLFKVIAPKFDLKGYWSMSPARRTVFYVSALVLLVCGIFLVPVSLAGGLMLIAAIPYVLPPLLMGNSKLSDRIAMVSVGLLTDFYVFGVLVNQLFWKWELVQENWATLGFWVTSFLIALMMIPTKASVTYLVRGVRAFLINNETAWSETARSLTGWRSVFRLRGHWPQTFADWYAEFRTAEDETGPLVSNGEMIGEYLTSVVNGLYNDNRLSAAERDSWLAGIEGRQPATGVAFMRPQSEETFALLHRQFLAISRKKPRADRFESMQASSSHVMNAGELVTHTAESAGFLGTFHSDPDDFGRMSSFVGYCARTHPAEWGNALDKVAAWAPAPYVQALRRLDEWTDPVAVVFEGRAPDGTTLPEITQEERRRIMRAILDFMDVIRPNDRKGIRTFAKEFIQFHLKAAADSGDMEYHGAVRRIAQTTESLPEAHRRLSAASLESLSSEERAFVERFPAYQAAVAVKLREIFLNVMMAVHFNADYGGVNIRATPVAGLLGGLAGLDLAGRPDLVARRDALVAGLREFDPAQAADSTKFASMDTFSQAFVVWYEQNQGEWLTFIGAVLREENAIDRIAATLTNAADPAAMRAALNALPFGAMPDFGWKREDLLAELTDMEPGNLAAWKAKHAEDFKKLARGAQVGRVKGIIGGFENVLQNATIVVECANVGAIYAFHNRADTNLPGNGTKNGAISGNLHLYYSRSSNLDAHVHSLQPVFRFESMALQSRVRNPQNLVVNPSMRIWASGDAFPATRDYAVGQHNWTQIVQMAESGRLTFYGKGHIVKYMVTFVTPPGEDSSDYLARQRTQPIVRSVHVDYDDDLWGRPMQNPPLKGTEKRYSSNVSAFKDDPGQFAVFEVAELEPATKDTHDNLWSLYFYAVFAIALLIIVPTLLPFSAFASLRPFLFYVTASFVLMFAITKSNILYNWRLEGSLWVGLWRWLADTFRATPFYASFQPFYLQGVYETSNQTFGFVRTVKEALFTGYSDRTRFDKLMVYHGVPLNSTLGFLGVLAFMVSMLMMTAFGLILFPYLNMAIGITSGDYTHGVFKDRQGNLKGFSFTRQYKMFFVVMAWTAGVYARLFVEGARRLFGRRPGAPGAPAAPPAAPRPVPPAPSAPTRSSGARLAGEKPAESPYLLPVTVGVVASTDAEFQARTEALRTLVGSELEPAFSFERVAAGEEVQFGIGEGTPFRVLVDSGAFEDSGAVSARETLFGNLETVARQRQDRMEAELARQEVFMEFLARVAPDGFSLGEEGAIERALDRLDAAALGAALRSIALPDPARIRTMGTSAGFTLVSDGRFLPPARLDENLLTQLLERAAASPADTDKVDALRGALSLAIGTLGESGEGAFARNAADAMRVVLTAYAKIVSQQGTIQPTDNFEGEKTIAVTEDMFRANAADYVRDAQYLISKNDQVRLALVIPVTPALRSLSKEERERAYRLENPDAGLFRLVFVEGQPGLENVRAAIEGPFILAGREGTPASGIERRDQAMLMQVDALAKTHRTTLVVAAKLLYAGKDVSLPGLRKLEDGVFRYLPAVSPIQLLRLLQEANASLRSISSSA